MDHSVMETLQKLDSYETFDMFLGTYGSQGINYQNVKIQRYYAS